MTIERIPDTNPHVDRNNGAEPHPDAYGREQANKGLAAIDMVAANQATKPKEDFIFRADSGVVLKLKKYSNRLMIEAINKLEPPPIPRVPDEAKGDGRTIENPNDPAFKAALAKHNGARNALVVRVQLGFGTEIMTLPDGEEGPDGLVWAEEIKDLLNLDMPAVGTRARYVVWLQYYALTDEELGTISNRLVAISTGVTLEAVEAAFASFPDAQERGATDIRDATEGAESVAGHTGGGSAGTDTGV